MDKVLAICDILFIIKEYLDNTNQFNLIQINRMIWDLCISNYIHDKLVNINKKMPDYLIPRFHILVENEINNLPMNIKYLTFGCNFNQPIILPDSLLHLTFGDNFNQPIILPDPLLHLTFGVNFNQSITLPDSLLHLTFGWYFNQPIILPDSLLHLEFGWFFNQPIILPNSLITYKCYNWTIIDNILPQTLKKIYKFYLIILPNIDFGKIKIEKF